MPLEVFRRDVWYGEAKELGRLFRSRKLAVTVHSLGSAVSTFTYLVRAGEVDLEAFIAQRQLQAIVYDIAPPYVSNWNRFGTCVSSQR